MNSTLTPPMHAVELANAGAFAPLRRALRGFILLMTQSGGDSQPGSQPGTPAPTDSDKKKKDNGQSTGGTKPMDPPTVQKKGIAPSRLRPAFEA